MNNPWEAFPSIHIDLLQERVSPLPRVETPTTEGTDGVSSVAPLTPKEETVSELSQAKDSRDRPSLFDARVTHLHQTCGACPSQWEGSLDNGHAIYIRYRWGRLQIGIGRKMDDAVDGKDGYAERQLGHEYDGDLNYSELVLAAKGLVPGLDFSRISSVSEESAHA